MYILTLHFASLSPAIFSLRRFAGNARLQPGSLSRVRHDLPIV